MQDVLRWGWMAPAASNAVWDNEGARAISARQVQIVRDAGALAELPLYLSALGIASAWIGDFEGAALNIAEAERVAAATGSRFSPWVLLRLRALQGSEAEASAAIASAIDEAAAGAQGVAAYGYWAAAVLYNGLARYEEAASWARQSTSDTAELWVSVWALPELVEASARAGDAEARTRCVRAARGDDAALRQRFRARHRGPLSGAGERGACRRRALSRSDRPSEPDNAPSGARPRTSALRRVAAPRGPTRRRARAAAYGPRHARRDRDGGVRGACPPGVGGDGRDGPQAQPRDARRADVAGGTDRPARARRPLEPGDRRAALPQPAHRRMASCARCSSSSASALADSLGRALPEDRRLLATA